MAKQIFTVHRNYYATLDVQVVAESEEEAIKKADKIFSEVNPSEFYFTENSTEVIDTKPTDDLGTLFDAAVKHIRTIMDNDGDSISFNIDVRVDAQEYDDIYNVSEDVKACVMTDGAYVIQDDAGFDEPQIMIQFEESYAEHWNLEDMNLEEFDEIEQIKILKAILG